MVQEHDVHMVCHTERMLRTLETKPDHPRRFEYAVVIEGYRVKWGAISADDRELIAAAAATIHDQTSESVASAVAALEG